MFFSPLKYQLRDYEVRLKHAFFFIQKSCEWAKIVLFDNWSVNQEKTIIHIHTTEYRQTENSSGVGQATADIFMIRLQAFYKATG